MNRLLAWAILFAFSLVANAATVTDAIAANSRAKPHLVMVIAEGEYKTDETLPRFAASNLKSDFRVTVLFANEKDRNDIPGLEALKSADIVLLSIRRRTLPPGQLNLIRQYIESGKPLVAIRTSSHAFCLRNEKPPPGLAEWPTFDKDVLGCNYHNHRGNKIATFVRIVPQSANHPILSGVTRNEFRDFGSLYQSLPLAKTARVLMVGRAGDVKPHEPVAWTNGTKSGGRVFYTSLGHPQDFAVLDFVRMFRNGIYWAAGLPVPEKDPRVLENPPEK